MNLAKLLNMDIDEMVKETMNNEDIKFQMEISSSIHALLHIAIKNNLVTTEEYLKLKNQYLETQKNITKNSIETKLKELLKEE